jgi:hypothetical protein
MTGPAPVSMLGKLFSLGSGVPSAHQESRQSSSSKPASSLESVQEDIHTRSLLFPDTNALYQHRNDQMFPLTAASALPPSMTPSPFDFNGDVDLEMRDVRVLVMQDALASVNASLLFDSHPGPVVASPVDRAAAAGSFQDARRMPPTSPRKSSLGQGSRPVVIQPDSPQLRQGAFDRRGSMHGRTQTFAETDVQRAAREYREELATFTSCIFGSSELLSYKGTSTKVHVVPTDSRYASDQSVLEGKGSVGRSSMRSSRLAHSYSSELVSPTHAPTSFMTGAHASLRQDRKKALITRLFPVVLATEDDSSPTKQDEASAGFPFPAAEDTGAKKKKAKPTQKRTPMYAVVLVVQLPPPAAAKTPFRFPGSLTDQDSFPSSFSSTRRSGWTVLGSGLFNDSTDSVFPFDGEDHMDFITQHWDIIMRTLTHLQSVVAMTLSEMLQQADRAVPDPQPSSHFVTRTPSLSNRRAEEHQFPKPPKTNSKIVALAPNCLAQDVRIMQEIEAARSRIVTGLKAVRVVTGQGRWGIWREEARVITKMAAPNDERMFFNLLTAFLAVHTDWLQALCPSWYRKRYIQLQRTKGEDDLAVSSRTIIVADDKMVARRLIFLLSAFLPAQQHVPTVRAHRPSTSASFGGLSHSPPSVIVPIGREESLRRKMTRRTGGAPRRASHSRTISQSTRTSIPASLAHLSIESHGPHHERRGSDTASIRTANVVITDYVSRMSNVATTATVAADTTVPHFSTFHRSESAASARPGTSESTATDDLRRTLTRGESGGHVGNMTGGDSRQGSRWSVISGLWSGSRRRDSTSTTAVESSRRPSTSYGTLEPLSPTKPRRPDRLKEMVREVAAAEAQSSERATEDDPETPRGAPEGQGGEESISQITKPRRWIDSPAFDSPIKATVNVEDGVVDVDVPFPDYLTSLDTAVSSPSSSGYLSTPGIGIGGGLESFEQSSRLAIDGDLPLNSAGWLQSYHPDFALQAIPPQQNLLERVKASLKAEPSPSIGSLTVAGYPQGLRWVDISSAIVADTTTGTIKRIQYRRLIRPKAGIDRSTTPGHNAPLLTPSILPYESQLEEEFVEDDITVAEDRLVEAVQRLVALRQQMSGDQSKTSSGGSSDSSRSNSKAPSPDDDRPTSRPPPSTSESHPRRPATVLPEVHRNECKTVVLTALSELIKDVVENRGSHTYPPERENAIQAAVRGWMERVEVGVTE